MTVTNAQTAGVAHTLAQGAVGLNTDSQGVQIAYRETSNSDDWSRNLIRARLKAVTQQAFASRSVSCSPI